MGLLGQFLRSLCGTRPAGSSRRASRPAPYCFRPTLDELEPRLVLSVSLGSAADYAVLGLQNTKINNSLVTINGNEGVSQGGTLVNMAPSTITGNVTEYQSGQYSGPGKLGGTVSVNPTQMTNADADALNASSAAAALTPTQTFGSITSPTTITGNSGLNVIQINGDINSSLILNGPANAVFIVNVTGGVNLTGNTTLGLAGGVTASNVLYNFTGSSGNISTKVGNVLNGTLLAPTYNFNLDGAFNGEIIGGGGSINMLSGTRVNPVPFTGNTTTGGGPGTLG
jgi:choice-of-anchor A domain-containing protein